MMVYSGRQRMKRRGIDAKIPVLRPIVEDEMLFSHAILDESYGIIWIDGLGHVVESAWDNGITVE